MLHLHDKTRRHVCVVGFLLLGLLPTLLVGGWCANRYAPGYVDAEALLLSRQIGLNVKLGGLQHLRPGTVLCEQVEAADPETGKTVFRCRLMEISRKTQTDSQGQRRPVMAIVASQPEVETVSLDRIRQCIERTLEGFGGPLETDVQLSASELTLRAAQDSQTLTEVSGSMENLTGGTHAQLYFRLAGVQTPEPARIRMVRNRQVSPPASGYELYTGGGELPCNVLAIGLRELKPLGSRCRFRGYIWANETSDGWQGEITGQLADVDLGGLVTDHFPHKLAGRGEVTIQSARFRRGRLEEGSAIVAAGPGSIDRTLAAAAVDRLGLVAAESFPDGDAIPYEQLAFSATLDAQGFRLQGRCTGVEPGTVLSRGSQRLLGESPQQPASAAALVQTLVPQNTVQVPASRQTDWLLRHLPVPEVMATDAVVPTVHARVREPWQR